MGLNDYIEKGGGSKVKNMLIYGEPLTGKTTLASKLYPGKTLLLSTDNNYMHLEDIDAIKISDFDTLRKVLEELHSDVSYDIVIVDLIEDVLDIARQHMLGIMNVQYEGDIPHGGGWFQMNRALTAILAELNALPQKVIFIAHAEKTTTKNEIGIDMSDYKPLFRDKYLSKLIGYVQASVLTTKTAAGYHVNVNDYTYTNTRFEHDLPNEMSQNDFIKEIKKYI